jgi:hypothetical protein
MKRRIIAWILLIGFVLLLLNLLVFKVYLELFSILYIIIFVAFIFLQGRQVPLDDSASGQDTDTDKADADTNSDADAHTDTNDNSDI